MPIEKKIFNDGHGVLEIGTGVITLEELISSDSEVFESEFSNTPPWFFIADYTSVVEAAISTVELRKYAHEFKRMVRGGNVIIAFASSHDVMYGFSRMWAAFSKDSGNIEMMSFKTRSEAEEWLITRVKERFGIDIYIPQ